MIRRIWSGERGVAMVTVLLVAAALTATASAAAFVTVKEFGATKADRNAAQALAFAEAGIDRMLLQVRNGTLNWNNVSLAGCDVNHPKLTLTGSIGNGAYTTTLEVFNRGAAGAARFIPSACSVASSDPRVPSVHSFLVSSTGTQPTARRVVRQVVDIKPLGLPVGIYAYEQVEGNGTVNMQGISLITEGFIKNRDNFQFSGTDPYYKLKDFYLGQVSETDGDYHMPSAAHAKQYITYGPASKVTEHRAGFEPNCEANRSNATSTAGQSLWDGSGTAVLSVLTSGCPTWPGSPGVPFTLRPPTSKFTQEDLKRVAPSPTLSEQDYLTLREAAKESGLYCRPLSILGNLECSEAGGPFAPLAGSVDESTYDAPGISKSFVAYFDYPNDGIDAFTREVQWSGTVQPCDSDPAINRTAVTVVRRASLKASGGDTVNGALLIPEGAFRSSGNFTMQGTIIARQFDVSGTITFKLDSCWINNMPGPFLDLTAISWSEVDR